MDQMIDGGKIPNEATASIWITNEGLRTDNTELSFDELFSILLDMASLAGCLAGLDQSAFGPRSPWACG